MSRPSSLALAFLVCTGAAACFAAPADGNDDPSSESGAGSSAKGVNVSTSAPGADLSCELAKFFNDNCLACHGAKPAKGVQWPLVGRADLLKTVPDEGGKRVIDLVLERLRDARAPMPPSSEKNPATPEEIALVEAWIKAETPVQSCGAAESPSAPPPAAPDPFATATVCTSAKKWTQGDHGSLEMHPGAACITCHAKGIKTMFKAAATFDIAGTVYPTGHEPDDCYGTTDATVVIEYDDGVKLSLKPNAAGNFTHAAGGILSKGKNGTPYTAKVVRGGVERVMKDKQTNGDCNSCHSEKGTQKAPGRIMAP